MTPDNHKPGVALIRGAATATLTIALGVAVSCSEEGSSDPAPDAGDTDTGTGDDTGPPVTDDSLCPDDQVCTEITEGGYMGCQLDGDYPSDLVEGCHEDGVDCSGNTTCIYTDPEQTGSVCSTNCGTCPDGETCSNVTGEGYFVCMVGEIYIPNDATTGCHQSGGCEGNYTCFYTNSSQTTSACIENCSPCYPGTCPEGEICTEGMCLTEPCTEGSCPDGEICAAGSCIPDPGPGPGENPGLVCDLPPLECEGEESYCGELIQFDPPNNPNDPDHDPLLGYIDYPENGESWDDQYRSWLRRDAVMMIQYAAAKTACYTDGWEFGNGDPIGLIDMSEENGAIPGTSVGNPGHPAGTHTNGLDIDIAYYQAFTQNNAARPICDHYQDSVEVHHCTAPPHLLDPWREAVFVGAIHEHPNLRTIGCDGKVGPILEYYIEILCDLSWIDSSACTNPDLSFEVTNQGWGWYFSHHHHIHVSYDQPDKGPNTTPQCLAPGCETAPLPPHPDGHVPVTLPLVPAG
jgi:hypothetical protein